MSQQKAIGRCEDCGTVVLFMATDSPWEFAWLCERGHRGVVSWAHAHPPPVFVGVVAVNAEPAQGGLFDGEVR